MPLMTRAGTGAAAMLLALAACSKPAPAAPSPAVTPATDVTTDSVPPAMVGVWTSTRGTTMRCIELHADGVYLMVPNTEAGDRFHYHGTWRVAGDQITWRDASQNWQADVNPMVEVADGHFVAVEADKSGTTFDRIAGPGATCPRT